MNTLLQLCKKFSVLLFSLSFLFLNSANASKQFRIGLVFDKGGKDDKSFNAAALQGTIRVKDDLKFSVKYVEATDDNAFESLLRSFAQKKSFDLIIAIGVSQVDPLRKVARLFKDQNFAIIDGVVDDPDLLGHVRSLVFEEHQGSYLVGAIAGMTSKSDKIGFIGGMDIPLIRRFEMGYAAGAKKINPKIKVVSNFIGVTGDSWNNPAKAKELAMSQYNSGVDVIFSAAGASNVGLFDAAEEKKKYAIGVDSNQNWVKPGYILTSMVKRVDQAVYLTCKDVAEGKFKGGVYRFGLSDQGVDYTIDQYNKSILPASVLQRTESLKREIISGKVIVPDYYKTRK